MGINLSSLRSLNNGNNSSVDVFTELKNSKDKINELKNEIDKANKNSKMIQDKMNKKLHDEITNRGTLEQKLMLFETGCAGAIVMSIGIFFFLSKRNNELLRQLANMRYAKEDAELLVHDIRKRSKIDSEKESWNKLKKASKDFLEVADNIENASQHAKIALNNSISNKANDIIEIKKGSFVNLVDGLDMTVNGLHKVFGKHNVKEISVKIGDKFDPSFHHAVGVEDEEEKESKKKENLDAKSDGLGYISKIVQKGYFFIEDPATILRPTIVIVSPNKKS